MISNLTPALLCTLPPLGIISGKKEGDKMRRKVVSKPISAFCQVFLIGIILLPSAGAVIGATSAPAKSKLDALYQAAKAEGKVVDWSATNDSVIRELSEKFKKLYPGIEVEHFEIQGQQAVSRTIAEAQVSKYTADVIAGNPARYDILLKRGLVSTAPYDWSEVFGTNPKTIQFGGYLSINDVIHPIAFNTNLVRREDAPKTWDALADPKWKGKIAMEGRSQGVYAYGMEYGERAMLDWCRKALANKPELIEGSNNVASAVAAGNVFISQGNVHMRILDLMDKGAPIDFVLPEVSAVQHMEGIFIMKNGPHPNAARVWAGFLTTPEALSIFDKNHYGPLIPGTKTKTYEIFAKRIAQYKTKIIYLDTLELELKKDDLKTKSAEVLAGLKK